MAFAPEQIARRLRRRIAMAVALFVALTAGATLLAGSVQEPETRPLTTGSLATGLRDPSRSTVLTTVRSWRDLRAATAADIMATDVDLVVLDPKIVDRLTVAQQVELMSALRQRRNDGERLLIAHLSIGYAEPDRPYARLKSIALQPSAGPDQAPVKYAPVKYWEPAWHALMFGRPDALLDRLVAAGYDGVMLAGADAYRPARGQIADPEGQMAALVGRLAAHARTINPSFVVVLGGAEEVLAHATARDTVDAVATSNVLFGINAPGEPNDAADIASALHGLKAIRRSGRPVFVRERTDPTVIATTRDRLIELGFVESLEPIDGNR
jgi:cysteinyl-tRNA synthetase, unknown class